VDRLEDVRSLGLLLGLPDADSLEWDSEAYANDNRVPHSGLDRLLKVFGLALSARALSMGVPHWFDILNKLANFRSSGRPPPTNHETSGERA
jgi:hypothetical protein